LLKIFPVTGNYEKRFYTSLNKIYETRIRELQIITSGEDVPEIKE